MLGLMARQKDFGMFVILGWERKWQKYADTADVSQDIFAQHHVNIMDMGAISRKKDSIADTIEFDGAVLVDDHGNRGGPRPEEGRRIEHRSNGPFFVGLQRRLDDLNARAAAT